MVVSRIGQYIAASGNGEGYNDGYMKLLTLDANLEAFVNSFYISCAVSNDYDIDNQKVSIRLLPSIGLFPFMEMDEFAALVQELDAGVTV